MHADPTEELRLAQLAQAGDAQAMEAILACHQGMIASLAMRLRPAAATQAEELRQAGSLGLMQAVLHYDAQRRVKLITYAVPWILGEMKRALRAQHSACLSLEEPIGERDCTLQDVLPGGDGVDVALVDLRLALSRLPKDEQTLICLRYFRDHSQKETACLLQKSQAQISRMERRALDALHALLA